MSCPSTPSGIVASQEPSGLCSYTPPTCNLPFTLNPNTSNCEYKISSVMDSCPLSSTKIATQLLCSYPICGSQYTYTTYTNPSCVSAPISLLTQSSYS